MSELKLTSPAGLPLRSQLRFLLKDSVVYGGAAAISKAFALVTFPLLARHFSLADYGVVDFFLVLASFLGILFIFGQDSAVARHFYEHEDTIERRQIISQSLVFQLAGLTLLLPLAWGTAGWLTQFMIRARDAEWLFKVVLLQLPFLLLINFSQNLLKWTFGRKQFLTMSLGFAVVQAGLLVVAVLVFDVGIAGVLLVSLCTSSIFGVLGLYFVRNWLTYPRDFRRLREMLPFAIPYGVICALGAFSPTLERSLTNQLLGAKDLGLYAAGTKVAMLLGLVASAFQTAWGPFSLSLYKEANAAQIYNLVLKVFALGICMIALLLALVAQPLIHLLASDRYAGAVVVVFPLAMGLAIQATSWIMEIGIGVAKRSYLNLYAYTTAVVVALGGILLLAPALGLLGVGLGVLAGHISKAFISSWLAQRTYPLPWHYGPVAAVLGLTLCFGMAAGVAGQNWGPRSHTLTLALGLLVVAVVGLRILFSQAERNRWLKMLRGRFQRFRAFL